jgi:hypothetical protein
MPTAVGSAARAALLGAALIAAGCASGPGQATRAAGGASLSHSAGRYLAIARPANHRLDIEVDGYADKLRDGSLAAAESDLQAEAATEHRFDQDLTKIAFPPRVAAIARALIQANQARIVLTERQALSSSRAELLSFATGHRNADAAVEVQVRLIRRALRLPPPENS